MPGLVPGIHVLLAEQYQRHGWAGQGVYHDESKSDAAITGNEYADEEPASCCRVIWNGVFRPLGLSVTKAAAVLGVQRATVSDLVNGIR